MMTAVYAGPPATYFTKTRCGVPAGAVEIEFGATGDVWFTSGKLFCSFRPHGTETWLAMNPALLFRISGEPEPQEGFSEEAERSGAEA
jgi:hypothetical protein